MGLFDFRGGAMAFPGYPGVNLPTSASIATSPVSSSSGSRDHNLSISPEPRGIPILSSTSANSNLFIVFLPFFVRSKNACKKLIINSQFLSAHPVRLTKDYGLDFPTSFVTRLLIAYFPAFNFAKDVLE